MFTVARFEFGPDFTFGVSTAAYQIEGGQGDGRGSSIWDTFSATPGNVARGDTGETACDHHGRWREDLDLVRDGGFDAYRFSFSWPRLIPEGVGAVNAKGVEFYDRLVDGMLERGIKPFATLYHWDLPSPLQDRGGWMNRDIAKWFADYAVLVQNRFGDRLQSVATINEPWCVAFLGHYLGAHAPGYRDVRAAARAMHHVLLAHGTAVSAWRAEGAGHLGIVLNLQKCEPADRGEEAIRATELLDGVHNRWYLDALFKGAYPADVLARIGAHMPEDFQRDLPTISAGLDWLGINYYTRSLAAADPSSSIFPYRSVDGSLEKTEMGWEIYPQGLTDLLVWVARDYTRLPLYVTENGMAEIDTGDDRRRVAYYDAHLRAVLAAREQGADTRGYFAWSLMDNFEWAEGYGKRFGLVGVDYATLKRTPRSSYRAFQGLLHNTR
ncbi:MAG TPA: GH1 family beta-glucosidase [Devosiaceae bacterium]